jgi:hypothetical protein
MNIPPEFQSDFEAFPPVLRALLDAELAAGNEVIDIGHGFPAPPAGAYIRLAKPLISRARASGGGIDYYDRGGSTYSGEITDAKRFFFLLEPPHPPEPEPDMDAIRAALQSKQAAIPADPSEPARKAIGSAKASPSKPPPEPAATAAKAKTAVERFRDSMVIDYMKWHEGVGYDLGIIKAATPGELAEIEDLLVHRPVSDWRDVQALAAVNSPRARILLSQALKSNDHELATAVIDYAPDLVSEEERVATLVAALEQSEIYGGLTQALLQIEEFHPPKIIDALFRGVLARDGAAAVHFSAMLMFLHGKAETSFDWDQRPFFLKFHTEVNAERQSAFRELCEKLGVDANTYLAPRKKKSSGHCPARER